MELDGAKTVAAFVGIIAVGTFAMTLTPMTTSTIFMMVIPSMVVYGLVMLALGVGHGQHRAKH
jgi:hypothetical protein